MDGLRRSDFCIADLTYARPSVYFEAGFAERSVQVIYTVRSDHLRRNQAEDLRVHFDLQMKPLITWKDPEDPSFPTRLERRLRGTVLRTWNRDAEEAAAAAARMARFSQMPLAERLSAARRVCMSALRRSGFNSWHAPKHPYRTYERSYVSRGHLNDVYSKHSTGETTYLATVHAFESITKTELKKLHESYSPLNLLWHQADLELDQAKRLVLNHFVLGLRPATPDRIESVFSGLRPVNRPFLYESPTSALRRRSIDEQAKVPFLQSWHFVAPIYSEEELRVDLKRIVAEYLMRQAA
jgi:hypothetical protein